MRGSLPYAAAALILAQAACSHSPQYYFDRAGRFAAEGNTTEAVMMYQKAVQKDSGFGEAYYQMGLILLRTHKTAEAYTALQTAVQLLPKREEVKVKLAELELAAYLSDPRHPLPVYYKVRELDNQMLAANAQSFDGLRLSAHLAAADKNYKEAERLYAQADALKPLQADLVLGWTETLLNDGQFAEAERQGLRLIAHEKTYGPIYDVLYRYYAGSKKLPEAENILKLKVSNNPADAGALLELASFYAATRRETEMQALLRRMENKPKDFPDARLDTGNFYVRLQRWDDALREYQEGVRTDPKRRIAYLRKIADAWLAQGKGEQAGRVVDEILKDQPTDQSALGVKASLLLATGKPDDVEKAAASLKGLVEASPENAVWHFNYGRALAAKGDLGGAQGEFQQAVKLRRDFLPPRLALLELAQTRRDYQESVRYADDILAFYPNLLRVRLVRASSLMYTGRDKQAEAQFALLEHAAPADPEVRLQLAMWKLHQRNFAEAEDRFRKIMADRKDDMRALDGLVETLTADNQTGRAITVLQEQLRNNPGSIPIRSMLARTAALGGQYDLVIDEYRQMLAGAPNSESLNLALGTTYRMKGDFPNAITYLTRAHELGPKDFAPLIRLGGALAFSGRRPEALSAFRDALKINPNDPASLNNTAYLVAETGGSLDEALKMAQHAVRLDSKQPNYADTLGWVYYKKKMNDDALQVFRALAHNNPGQATFRYHLALALLQQGDKTAARGELKAALADKPSDEVRRNIQAALAGVG